METIEERYQRYLQSDKKVIVIGNHKFYRIIFKALLPEPIRKVEIVVPAGASCGKTSKEVVDENGRYFHLEGPARMSFHGEIPRWYRETFTYRVDNAENESEIGEYVCFI